jgi:Zn-dependent protease
MVFAEPAPTRFDLRFRLGDVPVRIHPFFWVSTVCLALRPGTTLADAAIWVVAVFVSILVHELGHAGALARFGRRARITLYGFGGLASADGGSVRRSPRWTDEVIVSAAGPFAGFAFAALVVLLVQRFGFRVPFLAWTIGSGESITSSAASTFIADLMFINVAWGLVNLLPVHPLDGGQIALAVARARDPRRGVERSIRLSFFTAVVVAIVGLFVFGDTFTALLFGYLAVMNGVVLRRRYGVGFDSLSGAAWIRGRWRAWRGARRTRLRVVKTMRSIDAVDAVRTSAEVDTMVDELFESVAKNRVGPREKH